MRLLAGVLAGLAVLSAAPPRATAAVRVVVGPTPIVAGDARSAGDITVLNERLAFALAVRSAAPYGVPRGALVDLAPVEGGRPGRDRVVFADFIPDHWSAWPNTYQHVEILERGPRRAVVRTVRDWGAVRVETRYTLETGSDHVEIRTTLTNGGRVALPDLLSGLTLWPNSGFLFAVPGLQGVAEGSAAGALADRVVAYDADWAIALHAAYFDQVGDGSRDLYLRHTLAAGASRTFDAWLQVRPSGDLAPIVAAEIEYRHLPAGRVHGTVRGDDGARIAAPLVVIESHGRPYAWVMGHAGEYEVALPAGAYSLYATARNRSQSAPVSLVVAAHADLEQDFSGVQSPGRIEFEVTEAHSGRPLDARLAILEGQRPVVEFLGRTTFFTELDRPGRVDLAIAPGCYEFSVASGGGFLARSSPVAVTVAPGGTAVAKVAVARLFDPAARGWYAADLHHHGDRAEAVTPPADLARSQLAAGLDLLFVSDHDSVANHRALEKIARDRAVPFLPSMEFSASWGHFNAYPLDIGAQPSVDTSVATVDQLFADARRLGAIVLQVNHPFIPYGYFTSLAAGVVPGGFNPRFDALEVNASAPDDDDKVLHALWSDWDLGLRYYLAAGTDTHDVWNEASGRVRTMVHVAGLLSAAAFAVGVRDGHAYVTRGPLVYPSVPFGTQLRVKAGETFTLGFDLQSVEGLRRVGLVGTGAVRSEREIDGAPQTAHVNFPVRAAGAGWYALVVEDVRGAKAYTDPIWIEPVDAPGGAGAGSAQP